MQLIKKTKKGFTLVELIVVIAIVAILAAVSVVSYIAFINSANESADISLVKQLNLALQADEALHGKRSTMHEMLLDMEENGFVVENLTKTKSGYDIVWDQEHNRFGLFDGEKKIYGESSLSLDHEQYIWKFVDSKAEADAITNSTKFYSMYLTEAYINEAVRTIEVKSGIDVGINEITELTYNHTSGTGQTVTIRTNNEETVLNVDGKQGNDGDTVKHYGVAANVFENSCGKNSYDEYGYIVGYIFSKDGHVHVIQKSDTNISASAVVITSKTVSVDVEDDTPVIYGEATEDFTLADITAMQENINAKNNSYNSENPSLTPRYDTEELEENTGGLGTEVSPYVIATSEKLKESLNNTENLYYRLFKDITIDINDFENYSFASEFKGNLNGNKCNIIITNNHGKAMDNAGNGYRIIKKAAGTLANFNILNETGNEVAIVNGDGSDISSSAELVNLSRLTFSNINYGYEGIDKSLVISSDKGALFSQTKIGFYTFENCNNYYDIESVTVGVSGIFVGGRVNGSGKPQTEGVELHFTNCNNYGDVFSVSQFGILIGNANDNRNTTNTLISNCHNYGDLSSLARVGFINDGSAVAIIDNLFAGEKTLVNNGHFNNIENDGTTLTSDHAKQYFVHKGTANPNLFRFKIYESFDIIDSAKELPNLALSFNIQLEYTDAELNFNESGNATLPFQRTSYIGYSLWKQNYNSNNEYSGSWSTTVEGPRYFYYLHEATDKGMWVIDLDNYYAQFKANNNLSDTYQLNQDDLGTFTSISMIAYHDNDAVAYGRLSYNE